MQICAYFPILTNYVIFFRANPRTALKTPNFEFGPPPMKKAGSAPVIHSMIFIESVCFSMTFLLCNHLCQITWGQLEKWLISSVMIVYNEGRVNGWPGCPLHICRRNSLWAGAPVLSTVRFPEVTAAVVSVVFD